MPAETLIAQITDLHLQPDPQQPFRGYDLMARLDAVLEDIARQGTPDLLLMTGDLTHHGNADTYRWLKQRVEAVARQIAWIPGNHDLLEHMGGDLLRRSLSLAGWRILLLDSTSEPDGRGSGALAASELDVLEQQLSEHGEPTLVVLHHNPLATGSGWQDEVMLANPEPFWQLIQRFPQVKVVLHGHIHQHFEAHYNGVEVMATPAIAPQFKPRQQDFLLEDDPQRMGPGWRWLKLRSDGSFESAIEQI